MLSNTTVVSYEDNSVIHNSRFKVAKQAMHEAYNLLDRFYQGENVCCNGIGWDGNSANQYGKDCLLSEIYKNRVRYIEDSVKYTEMSCSIDVDRKDIFFSIWSCYEYEDGSEPYSYPEALTPHYSFEQFAESNLTDCIEQSYTWNSIFNDERYKNPRTDAPMWMHEELHELTEFMYIVQNLLVLAEFLPIEYTAEMQVSLQAFRNENWLYKQFEEVLNS